MASTESTPTAVELTARYPEHAKLAAVKEQSQAIGEFLDYSPYTLCEQQQSPKDVPRWVHSDTGVPVRFAHPHAVANPAWLAPGYYPVQRSIQDLLADWFGIDQDALEREKRAMLADLRDS